MCFICCFEFNIHVNSSFFIIWKFFRVYRVFQVIEQLLLFFSVKILWPVKSVVYDGWISARCRTKTEPIHTGLK